MPDERIREHTERLNELENRQKEILLMLEKNSELINGLSNKKSESVFLFVLGFCFMFVLIVADILTWLGVIDLRIVGQVDFPYAVEYIGNLLMFIANVLFSLSLSYRQFNKRILIMATGYIPIWIICSYIGMGQTMITSTLLPCLYIIIIMAISRNMSRISLLCFIISNVYMLIVQQLTGYVKLENMNFSFYQCNIATAFIYSIDMYLLYILAYKVVKYCGSMENVVRFPRFLKEACRQILANREMEDVSALNKRQRHIFFALAWGYLIAQSFLVIGLNVLINKFFHYIGGFYIGTIELVTAWIALELCRLALGKTFHAPPKICNAVSIAVGFIISRLGLPLHISLFYNVCLVGVIAWVIHKLVIKNDELVMLRQKIFNDKSFNLKSCTVEQLRQRCADRRFTASETDLCVMLFVDKLKHEDIANSMGYTVQYITQLKSLFKKRLT